MDGDIAKSVSHPIEDYGNLVTDGLFKWHNVVSGGAHLWFLYVYAVMILLFPALKGVREFTAKIQKRDLVLTCVLLGLLLINDIRLDGLLTISTASFGSVRGAFIIILYGDILYRNRELFEGKKLLGIAGLCLFVITNIVRAYIQYRCYSLDPISEEPIFWYTSYAVLCTTGLVVFGYGFSDLIKKFGKVIAHIGSRTFCVYLFHFCNTSQVEQSRAQQLAERQSVAVSRSCSLYVGIHADRFRGVVCVQQTGHGAYIDYQKSIAFFRYCFPCVVFPRYLYYNNKRVLNGGT